MRTVVSNITSEGAARIVPIAPGSTPRASSHSATNGAAAPTAANSTA